MNTNKPYRSFIPGTGVMIFNGARDGRPCHQSVGKGWRAPRDIDSDFVGIVHCGTGAADDAVIVDATMRQALANGDKRVAIPKRPRSRSAPHRRRWRPCRCR